MFLETLNWLANWQIILPIFGGGLVFLVAVLRWNHQREDRRFQANQRARFREAAEKVARSAETSDREPGVL